MKICIVDDDKLVALSLKTILEANADIQVCGLGENGKDAIDLFHQYQPDVLLMDIRMSEMTGLEAAEQLLVEDSSRKILLLTTFSDDEYIIKSLNLGVKGYILKQNFESIVPALSAVHNGQTVFGDAITTKLPELLRSQDSRSFSPESYDITEKEWEIIVKVADGLNNKEIASALYLSEGTVRNYLSAILEKLNLRDRTQLAVFYYRNMV